VSPFSSSRRRHAQDTPPTPPRITCVADGERWLRRWSSARLTRGDETISAPWADAGQGERDDTARHLLFMRRLVALGKLAP
jgi:hypothetical protein